MRQITYPVGVVECRPLEANPRKLAVFKADAANTGVIAIGTAGVTTANTPIVLGPGDEYREDVPEVAGDDWYAIASLAGQTLRIFVDD